MQDIVGATKIPVWPFSKVYSPWRQYLVEISLIEKCCHLSLELSVSNDIYVECMKSKIIIFDGATTVTQTSSNLGHTGR